MILECPLPDNHPSIEESTVGPDPDGNGVLILDPHLGPKWRFVSTRSPTVVFLPKNVEKITILNDNANCVDVRRIQVDFKAEETPLPDGKCKHICSFAKDELLQGIARIYQGSDRLQSSGRGGRGRGSGRGRGRPPSRGGKGGHGAR